MYLDAGSTPAASIMEQATSYLKIATLAHSRVAIFFVPKIIYLG